MLRTQFQGSMHCGFRQEGFLKFSYRKSIFSLYVQGAQPFEHLSKRAILGTFLPNFVRNPVVQEEMSFEAIIDDARRRTTNEEHPMITIAHHESMAQVS